MNAVGESLQVRAEAPGEGGAVEAVLARAFGPGRRAKTSERVRELAAGCAHPASRVAEAGDGRLVGCCRIWSMRAGEERIWFLGPLAVEPALQGGGIGLRLVREAVAQAMAHEQRTVMLMGRSHIFAACGFAPLEHPRGGAGLAWPGPVELGRVLWRPAHAGAAPPQGKLQAG